MLFIDYVSTFTMMRCVGVRISSSMIWMIFLFLNHIASMSNERFRSMNIKLIFI